jgi:hypothetical protein
VAPLLFRPEVTVRAWPIVLAATAVLLSHAPLALAAPTATTFAFTAQGFTPPGGPDPVSGSVTVAIDPSSAAVTGPVQAIDLTLAGTTYTPADTVYTYDPAVDRLSVQGGGKGPPSFDLELRKTSTGAPGPNEFSYFDRNGGNSVAGTTTVTVRR